MLISVVCPRCQSRYQVDAGLRGKRMRCLNPICRAAFEVRAEDEPAVSEAPKPAEAAPNKPTQVSGSVADLVPILPAEVVEPEPAPPPPVPPPVPVSRPQAPPTEKPKAKPPELLPPPPPVPPPVRSDAAPAAPSWEAVPPPVRADVKPAP